MTRARPTVTAALFHPGDPRTVRTAQVVTASTGTTSTKRMLVRLDGVDVDVPALRHVTPNVDDYVLLARDGAGLVAIGVIGPTTLAPPKPPAPETPQPAPNVTARLRPSTTGTARNGAWRTDTTNLYQGDWTGRGRNYGAAFYPAARNLTGAVVAATLAGLRRLNAGVYAAQAPTLRLLAQAAPAGTLTVLDTRTGPALAVNATGSAVLPAAWGAQLVAGTAGGIGIGVDASSPYLGLAGRAAYADALTLTLTLDPN